MKPEAETESALLSLRILSLHHGAGALRILMNRAPGSLLNRPRFPLLELSIPERLLPPEPNRIFRLTWGGARELADHIQESNLPITSAELKKSKLPAFLWAPASEFALGKVK